MEGEDSRGRRGPWRGRILVAGAHQGRGRILVTSAHQWRGRIPVASAHQERGRIPVAGECPWRGRILVAGECSVKYCLCNVVCVIIYVCIGACASSPCGYVIHMCAICIEI